MKILIYSDIHIGEHQEFSKPTKSYPTRILEILETGAWISEMIRFHKPGLVVCCGDVFHDDHYISALSLSAAGDFMKGISQACQEVQAEHVVLPGNHDTFSQEINSLSPFSGFAFIPTKPTLHKSGCGFVPFIRDDLQMNKAIEEILSQEAHTLFIHQDVQGTLKPKPVQKLGLNPSDWKGTQMFGGHIHPHLRLGSIEIVGSALYQTFGDKDTGRGICLYDTNTKAILRVVNSVAPEFRAVKLETKSELEAFLERLTFSYPEPEKTYLRLIFSPELKARSQLVREKLASFRGIDFQFDKPIVQAPRQTYVSPGHQIIENCENYLEKLENIPFSWQEVFDAMSHVVSFTEAEFCG